MEFNPYLVVLVIENQVLFNYETQSSLPAAFPFGGLKSVT